MDERGGVVVPVTIDGSGPFRFMLDTGSSRSAVADDLASELAARLVARTEVVSSAGPEMHDVARLERVELAGARATFLLASVIPAARLRTIGSEIRGVLAQDFLSEFNYTLDYRRGRLTWDGTGIASCDNRAAVPLVASEGRYVVKVSDGRSQSLRLVPDSGADSLVLFASPRTDDAPTAPGTVSVTGVTGSARARKARAPRLIVGDVTLPNSPAVIVERDYAESDGLLPLHFFASVSFNMQDGCMIVRAR
ncbi:MAG: aspartyl protease family protein [Actinomycetes bacterium]